MHVNLEAILLSALGIVMASEQVDIDHVIDNAADKIVAAVKSSETAIDDFAAKQFAAALARLSERVSAGLTEAV